MKNNQPYHKWILLLMLCICCSSGFAQRDIEFWFAAPDISHHIGFGTVLDVPIYLRMTAYDHDADVTIDIPSVSSVTFPPVLVHIVAGTTQSVDMTPFRTQIECGPPAAVLNTGLHIVSTKPISAYYELGCSVNSEIWTLKGKNAVGTDYYIPAQNFLKNWAGANPGAYSKFDIVATEDNTTVTITPSVPIWSNTAMTTSSSTVPPVTLNKGQTYSAESASQAAASKINGSKVHSDKPVAITVTDDLMEDNDGTFDYWGHAYDAGGDQIIPLTKIGKEYIAVRGGLNTVHPEKLFVLTTVDNTTVSQDGAALPLIVSRGTTVQLELSAVSSYITADQPIYLSQLSGVGAETGWDVLPPVTCNGSTSVAYVRTPSNSDAGVDFLLSTRGGQNTFSYIMDDGGTITSGGGLPGISSAVLAASFTAVPGAPSGWGAVKVHLSTSDIPAGASIRVRNTTLFNMGVNTGNTGQTGLFGYFSNFGSFDIVPVSNSACYGDTLRLTADSFLNGHYSWTGPAGFTSTDQNPVIFPFLPVNVGWYYLHVSSDSFCTSYDSVYVTAGPHCCDGISAFLTINGIAANNDTICYGDVVPLYGSGGAYGMFYIDGGADQSAIMPVPMGGLYDTLPAVLATAGTHTLCWVVYTAHPDSALYYCSDTICQTFTVINCCTRPTAVLTINGSSAPIDTLCYGDSIHIEGSGSVWGMGYIDSMEHDNHYELMPLSFSGPLDDPSSIGTTHTICLIVSTDSAGGCADTICRTVYIRDCCTKPVAVLDFPDSICIRSGYYMHVTGGVYGQLILDDTTSLTEGLFPVALLDSIFPNGLPTDKIQDSLEGSVHRLCFVAYSDTTPYACTDTMCKTVRIVRCHCDNTTATMGVDQTGPMTFDFTTIGAEVPDFVQWYVDGSYAAQTDGTHPFVETFTAGGTHLVCMHAGYVHPTEDGHGICCYRDTCVEVHVDLCDIHRSSDSVSYSYDSLDFHTLHFKYKGDAPTSIKWSWDNEHIDYDNDTLFTHTFPGEGHYTVCAYVVWSKAIPDSNGCCCLDTICVDVDINPCAVPSFHIERVASGDGSYVYQVMHSGGFVTFGAVSWAVNSAYQPSYTGSILTYTPAINGIYTVCASYDYNVTLDGAGTRTCHGKDCFTDTLEATQFPPAKFKSYPNPTNGDLIIEITNYDGHKTANVEIADITGQVVMTKTIGDLSRGISQNYMNVSILPPGIYTLKMSMDADHQINKLVRK